MFKSSEGYSNTFLELGANELLQKSGQFHQAVAEVDCLLKKFVKQV